MELSLVIPVFNGAQTIESVVEAAISVFSWDPFREQSQRLPASFEIVLVNDGSRDDSERVCHSLAERHPGTVRFLQLSRNFGEHQAVLAGLAESQGDYCVILDDDGQHPPEEALRLWRIASERSCDVVYGHYREKRHHWFRNLGSRFNGVGATWLLKKPAGLYLSSFKVMNRFLVREVIRYRGPFPYIDGLIFQATDRIEQIEVAHRDRAAGRSGYTLRKLARLWLNMFLGFSVAPLRAASLLGFGTAAFSALTLVMIVVDKLVWNPEVPVGIPTVLICVSLFAGLQMFLLGMLGEYIGRIVLTQNGQPQSVIRYRMGGSPPPEPAGSDAELRIPLAPVDRALELSSDPELTVESWRGREGTHA